MAKAHKMISLDPELVAKAKEGQLNVSALTEDAIRRQLGKAQVEIETTIEACEFCGKTTPKAFQDNHNKRHKGLTWLYPDEKWICPNCLYNLSTKVFKCA